MARRRQLEEAIRLNNKSAEAYHNLARILLNQKNPDGEIQDPPNLLFAKYSTS
jgi:hypothetical protein